MHIMCLPAIAVVRPGGGVVLTGVSAEWLSGGDAMRHGGMFWW